MQVQLFNIDDPFVMSRSQIYYGIISGKQIFVILRSRENPVMSLYIKHLLFRQIT